jgi:signal peptidase II
VGFILPALIVIILDQVSKQIFWQVGQNFDLIDNFLRITLVRNSGAAFGMFQGGRIFLIISSVLASVFLIFIADRMTMEEKARRIFLGMILGGALGNLVDRIYPGHVIDFIDMGIGSHRWPVYNLADAAVTIGGTLLILGFARSREHKQQPEEQSSGQVE